MSFDEIIQAIDRLVVDLKEYKETDDIDKDKDKDIDNIPTINDNDINNNEIDDKKNDDMAMPDKCVSSETTTNDDIEPPSPSSHRPPPPTIQSSLETITLRNTQTVIEIKKVKKIKEYEWLGSLEKVVELVNYLSSPRLEFVWYRDAILCATDQAKLIEEMWKLTFLLEPYVSKSYLVFGGVHELVSKLLRLVNTFQEEKSMFINSMATHWKLLYRLGATVKRLNEVLLIELSTIALEGIEIANEHRTMGLNNVDELIRRVNSGEKYELLALEGLYAVISSYTDDTALIPNEKVVEVAKQFEIDTFLVRMIKHMDTPVTGLLHEDAIKSAASTLLSVIIYLRKKHGLDWLLDGMVDVFMAQARTLDVSVLMDTLFMLCMVLEKKENRDHILQSGVVDLIIQIASRPMTDVAGKPRSYTEYLTGIIRFVSDKPFPPWAQLSPLMPCLAHMISELDGVEELFDVCRSLSNMTQHHGFDIVQFHQLGFLPHLLRLLGHSSIRVSRPALATIGNIISNDDTIAQTVFCEELFARLKEFTKCSGKNPILKETLWIISNIIADSRHQIQMCIDNGLLLTSFERFLQTTPADQKEKEKEKEKEREKRIRDKGGNVISKKHLHPNRFEYSRLKRKHGEEMMWIIHNVFTTASPEQIDYCVSHGCLDVFVSISLLIMSDSKARHRWVGVLHLIMSTRQSKAHLIELGVMQVVYDLLKITGDSEEFDTLRTVEGDFLELLNI